MDGIDFFLRTLHRVGRRALLGKMHYSVRFEFLDQVLEALVLDGNINIFIADFLAGVFFPGTQSLRHG